ncbi:MAG TPA: hypothetical protein VGH33_12920 [Isosphaeraceae bacterium]|jgi:hypothetical protein
MRFANRIAPRAVTVWAAEQGYEILQLDRIYFGSSWFAAKRELSPALRPANMHVLYWAVVRTSKGVASEAWLVVGDALSPCQSASRCPVRVQWRGSWFEDPKPLSTPNPGSSPMWDEAVYR